MIQLRDYQAEAIDRLRDGVRAGHKHQVLSSPTGSGKTVCGLHLMNEAKAKTAFICDRIALVDQTSAMLEQHNIQHGVIQAGHWRWRPNEKIQVCSAQTLARRGIMEGLKLIIVDECHTLYKTTVEFIRKHPEVITVGLTATPFSKGLGKVYSNVVNTTTTDRLIEGGWLVPLKAYAAVPMDMTGARVKFDGEWAEEDMEKRGIQIAGNVVDGWIEKVNQHFGGPVKTIVFSATVDHGTELCRQFQAHGHNFQQISYKDGNDERRRELISEFRKDDSSIIGLVSCEALAKGFDVPDILCGISCRPYRKSLSGHIQQLGRVMRPSPGKEFALWLDHAGNFLRFHADTQEFFCNGVSGLNLSELDSRVRGPEEEKKNASLKCGSCGYIMSASMESCPSCGWHRPLRSNVAHVDGELFEVGLKSKASARDRLNDVLKDRGRVWRQIVHYALERKRGDATTAERFAKAQFRQFYGTWPNYSIRDTIPEPADPYLVGQIKRNLIAYFNRSKQT
jgi:superfamily II DNA or RNA helicase